ncbi:hypothetical protein M422DRAFT_25666 [Sphaerobolus stellatus SS14]|nr:hypothetical protein M422DRAFT_25666 [Sphaerobolus stellatus SS14]
MTREEEQEIKILLNMPPNITKVIPLSNDHPTIAFQVRKMCAFANTYQDLASLIPSDSSPESPPPPFMVFTNSRTKTRGPQISPQP